MDFNFNYRSEKIVLKKGFFVAENPKTKITLEYAGVQSSFGCLQQYQMAMANKTIGI